MKKIKGTVILTILTAAAFLSACAASSGSDGGSRTSGSGQTEGEADESGTGEGWKDTLHIAISQQAPSLDLHKNSTLCARQIMDGTVWEKLVTQNANAEPVPELCERYEVSDDGKTITFYLRKGVLFHDGTEMTADDVTASMNRWIEGFSSAASTVGDARFETVDDSTVISMVELGLGYSILSELILEGRQDNIIARPLEGNAYRPLGITLPSLSLATPLISRFIDYSQRVVRSLHALSSEKNKKEKRKNLQG